MKKAMLAAALVIGAMAAGPVAQAGGVNLGISIGVPGVVWGGPAYYPPPPPPRYYYTRPPVVVVPEPVYVPGPAYYGGWRGHGHWEHRGGPRWNGHRGDRGYWRR